MEQVIFKEGIKGGEVTVPPAKSFGHRSIICAALAEKPSVIENLDMSEDMKATLNFLTALGGKYEYENRICKIYPVNPEKGEITVDCGESGSTLRFIIPIIAALGLKVRLIGRGRLPERPLNVFTDLLPSFGVCFEGTKLPLTVCGKLKAGKFTVPGNISSQFISGLLFALPLLEGDSEIEIVNSLESGAYIDMTVKVLSHYGIEIEKSAKGYCVKGGQKYKAVNYMVEGDWSQAAFFLTMGALSEEPIEIYGLNYNSVQGDMGVLKLYEKIGARIDFTNGILKIQKGSLKAIDADMHDMPDAVPALSALLALCEGKSTISGAARLRIKESDRLKSVSDALNCLGAEVLETSDGLVINGVKSLSGGKTESCNDHRILMAMASVRSASQSDIIMSDAMCINKSYPDFYKDYNKLGGKADVINLG